MKTEKLRMKGNYLDVVNFCRSTVSKPAIGKEPSDKFKRDIMISEHSPIRTLSVIWEWTMPSWVATHFSRHRFEKYISTQRTDRTGEDRNGARQDTPVRFIGEANAQNLIDVARKRLCYSASPETRAYMMDLKLSLQEKDKHLAYVLVPNCIYRGGCPEPNCKCKYWENFYKKYGPFESIQERYDAYNNNLPL